MAVICPYCKHGAELTTGAEQYPDQPHLAANKVWVCRFCDARVGCRDDTDIPLGSLADGKLRAARQAGHDAFDRLWREMWRLSGGNEVEARLTTYGWLAEQLGVLPADCRFAMFGYEQCLKATLLCRDMQEALDRDRGTQELF